jgi:hypothetical protein
MKTALLMPAALLVVAILVSACQSAYDDPEKYRRDHERYIRTIEPKTGGPDL